MSDRLERNKETAKAFYDLDVQPVQAARGVERYVGDEYIQHNPEVADGKQAFIDYFERMAASTRASDVTFKRAIAEGDLVVLHCHQEWPGDQDYAGIDIFRFDETARSSSTGTCCRSIPDLGERQRDVLGCSS